MFRFFSLVMWDLSSLTRDRKTIGPPGKRGVPFLATHLYQAGALFPDPLVSWKSLHLKSLTEASGKPIATQVDCKCRQKAVSVQFSSVAQSCRTLCDPMKCSQPGAVDSSSVHGDSPGKNTGVGCHAFGHLGIYQREMYI